MPPQSPAKQSSKRIKSKPVRFHEDETLLPQTYFTTLEDIKDNMALSSFEFIKKPVSSNAHREFWSTCMISITQRDPGYYDNPWEHGQQHQQPSDLTEWQATNSSFTNKMDPGSSMTNVDISRK